MDGRRAVVCHYSRREEEEAPSARCWSHHNAASDFWWAFCRTLLECPACSPRIQVRPKKACQGWQEVWASLPLRASKAGPNPPSNPPSACRVSIHPTFCCLYKRRIPQITILHVSFLRNAHGRNIKVTNIAYVQKAPVHYFLNEQNPLVTQQQQQQHEYQQPQKWDLSIFFHKHAKLLLFFVIYYNAMDSL